MQEVRFHTGKIQLALYAMALTMCLMVACGPQNANVTPQSRIAHYGAEVTDAVTQVQTTVNESTKSGLLPVGPATQITNVNQRLHDAGAKLSDLLKQYDAATTLDARELTEAQIELVLSTFNQTIGEAIGIKVEGEVATQLTQLYGNVLKVVAAVQGELAKGMGGNQ